jgi:hypothetical protein
LERLFELVIFKRCIKLLYFDEVMGNIEEIIPKDQIMLREIVHICVVVRDVETTAEAFAKKFGIGPWRIRVVRSTSMKKGIQGQPSEFIIKFGWARLGPITLELAENVSGATILQEFLEKHGEGIHHIGLPTPVPFDSELDKWKKFGVDPLLATIMEDPEEGWAYMDTENLVGCILEILSFKRYQE